ncbi:hypothetical protein ACFORH_42790 [Amycolatopsis roodepoortensis]|uniref:Helix-turn-helix domain-containing protein n=1 Tax=Amycolatopsis roodepoortensis TaxID=700274 RepID=A0ABR9L2P1_9PSEU|nr:MULTISPECIES: helix-turn-helix transcriptional regulator [Amycolatopsis]MBE1575028.1 hypothetical protein [Amycolatopsis roodepoortensis]GHG97420.1 hypothetical protein GCM10017788_76910 [Amycolatopsis acidiphila]
MTTTLDGPVATGCETCKGPGGKKDCPVHGDTVELATRVRPHGRAKYVFEGCHCEVCRKANTAYAQKRYRRNALRRSATVESGPVREHVLRLKAAGLGLPRIAELAGIHKQTVQYLMHGAAGRESGPARRIRRATAELILAVDPATAPPMDLAVVDGTGTRRRLQALCALGWSQTVLGRRLGLSQQNLSALINGGGVRWTRSRQVTQLYDEMWNQKPAEDTAIQRRDVAAVRRNAVRRGWAPPMAWDDDAIDDPAARPAGVRRPARAAS